MDESPKTMLLAIEERTSVCDEHGDYQSKAIKFGEKILHWSGCPDCIKVATETRLKIEADQAVVERQRQMESRMNRAGIPARYRTKDFSAYKAATDKQEKALSIAMEFATNFKQHAKVGTVVVFSGLPGTGKSHLAIAIAQAIMQSETVLYTSAIDAVRMIRETWRKDSPKTETQVLDELSGIGLLILDEVGVQYGTDAEQVNLFDIIDKRYRDQMPMILLTNQNKAGMKAFLGDRSFDRLRENGIWVTFDWESQRGAIEK